MTTKINGLRVWTQEEKSAIECLHHSKLSKITPLKAGLLEAGLCVVEYGEPGDEKIIATTPCSRMEITLTRSNFVVNIKGEEKAYNYSLVNVLGFWDLLRNSWGRK